MSAIQVQINEEVSVQSESTLASLMNTDEAGGS